MLPADAGLNYLRPGIMPARLKRQKRAACARICALLTVIVLSASCVSLAVVNVSNAASISTTEGGTLRPAKQVIKTAPLEAVAPPVTEEAGADAEAEPIPEPDRKDVEAIARMLWGEARGVKSDAEKAACVWCVLNRVDDTSGLWPDTIIGVLAQPNQFSGYSPRNPVTTELYELARDVLIRWYRERSGEVEVGRVLPSEYVYFFGDGERNYFYTTWPVGSSAAWAWALPDPYES